MPTYVWKCEETGEVVEIENSIANSDSPPNKKGSWTKVLGVGLAFGRVEGAGGSPAQRVTKQL